MQNGASGLVAILVPGADTLQTARTRDALSALSGTVAIILIGGEEIPISGEQEAAAGPRCRS
jgi:hypothetical protein